MGNSTDYKKYPNPVKGHPDHSEYWELALQGRITPSAMGDMQCGYYKYRSRGAWGAVCVRKDAKFPGGLMVIDTRGPKETQRYVNELADRESLWSWCAKHAVPRSLFYEFFETGKWRDQDEKPRLSNLPDDPFEAAKLELADKKESAERLLKQHKDCPDKETADKAANIAAELRALIARFDKLHKTEKDYWLQGGREVDGKFRFRTTVQAETITPLTTFYTKWQAAEQRRLNAIAAEEQRKRDAEAEAAREAERVKAAELAAQFPGVDTSSFDEPAPAPKYVAPQRVQVGGAVGSKVWLRKAYKATLIDRALALAAFGDSAEVTAALQSIADRLAKEGKEKAFIPGFRVTNELDEVLSDGINPKKDAA